MDYGRYFSWLTVVLQGQRGRQGGPRGLEGLGADALPIDREADELPLHVGQHGHHVTIQQLWP